MADLENPEIRYQDRYVGETKAAIRPVDLNDKSDIARLLSTLKNERTQEWMDEVEGMTYGDIKDWIKTSTEQSQPENRSDNRNWEITYAVVGSPENVKPDEVSKLQGFINFYTDQDVRDRLRRNNDKLSLELNRETQIVEVGMAKWPKAPKHQMSSGLRQAAFAINQLKGKGVDRTEGKYSTSMEPQMIMTAYIDPENTASMAAFEDAGFVNRGLVYYDTEENRGTDDGGDVLLYTLDWEKLNQKMHESSDKLLFHQD